MFITDIRISIGFFIRYNIIKKYEDLRNCVDKVDGTYY